MIGYPRRTPHLESTALLQTNRQVNAEVHEAIARLYSQRRMNSGITVSVYREKYLLLDWHCLPVNSLHYDTWTVNLRLVEPPMWNVDPTTGETDQSMLETFYPDRYPRVLWCYFYILQRFLERGPGFRSNPEFHITQAPPRTRSLRRMVLNVLTGTQSSSSSPSSSEKHHYYFRRTDERQFPNRKRTSFDDWHAFYGNRLIDPRCFAEQLRFLIDEWLFGGRLQAQARMAFDSIETIEMQLDGEPLHAAEWHVRTMTGSAYESPTEKRLAVFEQNTKLPVDRLYGCLVDPDVVKDREEKLRIGEQSDGRKRKQADFCGREDSGARAAEDRAVRRVRR